MKLIIPTIVLIITLAVLSTAYTVQDYENMTIVLDTNTYEVQDYENMTIVLGDTVSCYYDGTGDWEVECSENCTVDLNRNVSGTVNLKGKGFLNVEARLYADKVIANNSCEIRGTSAGMIISS